MDILSTDEIDRIIKKSHLALKYNQVIDRESAYEILNRKVAQIADQKQKESNQKSTSRTTRSKKSSQSEVGKQVRSEEHTSELQSRPHLVCRLLLEKKK